MLKNIISVYKQKLCSRLGKDISYTLISQLSIMVLALVINKLLSVMLGVEGYGQYSIIKRSSSVLSFVMLSGMGIALPRYLAIYNAQKDNRKASATVVSSFLIVAIISLIVISSCIIFKETLSNLIIGIQNNRLYFSAIFFAFSLTATSLLYAYYRGTGAFVRFSLSQILVQLLITLSVLFFGKNLYLLLNIWTFAMISFVATSLIIEKKNYLYRIIIKNWKYDIFPQLKVTFQYGIPRLVGDFFLFSFAAFPLIFISHKLNIESASFFAVGITLVTIVTPLFSFLGMVLLPYVSSSIAENNFTKADTFIRQLIISYTVLSFAAIILLWLGINIFIPLFFSNEFLPAAGISKILIITILFESFYLLLRNPIDAISTIPYNTYNLILSFVILIVLFIFSNTLKEYAFSFLLASAIKAGLTFFVWQINRRKLIKMKPIIN